MWLLISLPLLALGLFSLGVNLYTVAILTGVALPQRPSHLTTASLIENFIVFGVAAAIFLASAAKINL